jgi:hypothetical protein
MSCEEECKRYVKMRQESLEENDKLIDLIMIKLETLSTYNKKNNNGEEDSDFKKLRKNTEKYVTYLRSTNESTKTDLIKYEKKVMDSIRQ